MTDVNKLPLRLCAGIVLLNSDNKIFVGKRIDLSKGILSGMNNEEKFWQLPQGGIDQNENFLDAAKRELEEETGIKSVELIKEVKGWLKYYFPKNLLNKIWKGKYGGQKQKWFIMRFEGKNNEINIKTKDPEFLDWKWIEISKLSSIAVDFKIHIYKKLTEELTNLKLN